MQDPREVIWNQEPINVFVSQDDTPYVRLWDVVNNLEAQARAAEENGAPAVAVSWRVLANSFARLGAKYMPGHPESPMPNG